jgi:hypothetical protein
MALSYEIYERVVAEGGCVYGGGTKGQGNGICRSTVAPGQKYCPRHLCILAAKAAGITPRTATKSR